MNLQAKEQYKSLSVKQLVHDALRTAIDNATHKDLPRRFVDESIENIETELYKRFEIKGAHTNGSKRVCKSPRRPA